MKKVVTFLLHRHPLHLSSRGTATPAGDMTVLPTPFYCRWIDRPIYLSLSPFKDNYINARISRYRPFYPPSLSLLLSSLLKPSRPMPVLSCLPFGLAVQPTHFPELAVIEAPSFRRKYATRISR
ncbi:unnamed protein product [Protopolystoma xenopodis]|uniref:Uncharacterized protein n=1 Tax=Protopolystoma xenopodis TaxID=117903 RepID=A0A3S5B640_9PLAT|nr:unnamed protein product [Protopolystoma xenopodis]